MAIGDMACVVRKPLAGYRDSVLQVLSVACFFSIGCGI